MRSLENKVIVYDSNCKVCTTWKDLVVKFTSIPEWKIRSLNDLEAAHEGQVDREKFRNVMALVDTTGRPTLYGAEGIAYIFSTRYQIVDRLARIKPVFDLFNFFYKTQAYNRYIIATPKSKFKCDCFPDRVVKFRVSYIIMTVLLSVLLTLWFGFSLAKYFPELSGTQAAMQMLLIAGTGWVLQIILALIVLRGNALDYIGHLGSIMVVGLLILVPSILFDVFTNVQLPYIPAVSVLASSAYMLHMHITRARHLELSQRWTASWFFMLQSTALMWIYLFHFHYSV